MSVRKITFARVDDNRYVNHETGVEITRGLTSGVWYVWVADSHVGTVHVGSRSWLPEARALARPHVLQARAAIAAAYDEAADINARREMDEAAEWQATPAYRRFARATLVGKGYRAALDILHDEALVEDRRRAGLQSRWDAAARRGQDVGRVLSLSDAHAEALTEHMERASADGPACTRECIKAQPYHGGHIESCPRKAYILSLCDDAIRWPHDIGRVLSVKAAHAEALTEDAQRYAARLYDVPLALVGGPRPTAADALRRVLDALGRGVSPSHVVAEVAEELGVEL